MKPKVRHYGKVDDAARLQFFNSELWHQQLISLRGKNFELIISERFRKPSRSQINYYFGGICGSCFQSEDFSQLDKADDVHYHYFSPKFLSYSIEVIVKGQKTIVRKERSLTDLSYTEMTEFIERVKIHCESELGIRILTPDEYYDKHYK